MRYAAGYITGYAAGLIVLLLLFTRGGVYGQAGYSSSSHTLEGVVPDNQVKQIVRDKKGFYWIITSSGWLLRWNGKQFVLPRSDVQGPVEEPLKFWNCNVGRNGELFFHFLHGGAYYKADRNDRLVIQDVTRNDSVYQNFYTGDFFTLNNNGNETGGLNKEEFYVKFRDFFLGLEYGYTIGKHRHYWINAGQILYYEAGRIFEIPYPQTGTTAAAWRVGNYLLVKNGSVYKLYDGKQEISAGNDPVLAEMDMFKKPYAHATDSSLFLAGDKFMYKFRVVGNKLKREKLFELPLKKAALNFYADEQADRFFFSGTSGGFMMYEKQLFLNQYQASHSERIAFYTLYMGKDRLYNNKDFQAKFGAYGFDYNYSAPFVPARNGDWFYPHTDGFSLTDSMLNNKKEWKVPYGSAVRSLVSFNEHIYVAADKLWKLNLENYQLDTVRISPVLASTSEVRFIAKGPGNTLCVVIDSSFYKIDPASGKRERLSNFSIGKGVIRSLVYDAGYNVLFFTLSGDGLYYMDMSSGIVRAFPIQDFKSLLSCHYMLKDKEGDFWLPTNNGLYLMQKKQFEDFYYGRSRYINYYRFGKVNGISNEEFNGGFSNSGILVDDSVHLASMGGVVSFNTREVKKRLGDGDPGQLSVVRILVDDSLHNIDERLILPPDFKRCVFRMDFPFINMPSANLEYQLKGSSDTSWSLLTAENEVLLGRLRPGHYTLTIRIADHPQISPIVIPFRVMKYWYKTTVAYLAYGVFLAGIIFLLFNWRTSRIRNNSLIEIDNNRRELFAIISHDLRSPLKAYQGLADVVSDLVREQKYDRIAKVAAQIDSTGSKLDLLLNNLLNWNLLQQEKLMTRNEQLNLSALLAEHTAIYHELAILKGLNILVTDNGGITIDADRDMVSLMIRNLLDNAIKNSVKDKEIRVSLNRENEKTILKISNAITAAGREKLEKVKQLFESNKTWEPGEKGMGMGLKMVQMAARKINAVLKVDIQEQEVVFSVHF